LGVDPRLSRQNAAVGRRAVIAGLALLYVAVWAFASLILKTTPSDLDLYFWPSAQTILAGHPLLIYASHPGAVNPNDNGPLGLLPLIPVVALANLLGWSGNLGARAALAGAVTAIFLVLLAYQAVRLIARARGGVEWPLAAACTILLAPAIWIGVIDYGHTEQPVELCLVLLAVGCALSDRWIPCGIALGAAMLTRSTTAFCAIPFVLLPLATRRVTPATLTVIVAVVTVVVGLLPFVIADQPAVLHSLLTYRSGLPIGDGSFWVLARQTSWAGIGQYGDLYLALAAAAALVAAILWRHPVVATTPAGLLGLITVASACFPLFSKSVFAYYLVEPSACAAIWWLARPGSARTWRALVPLLLAADAVLAQTETALPRLGWTAIEGVIASACLAVVVLLVTADLARYTPEPRIQQRSPSGAEICV
jgi:hypothetical protein